MPLRHRSKYWYNSGKVAVYFLERLQHSRRYNCTIEGSTGTLRATHGHVAELTVQSPVATKYTTGFKIKKLYILLFSSDLRKNSSFYRTETDSHNGEGVFTVR